MLTPEQVHDLCAKALSYSTFPECSVNVTSTEQTYTRFANNGITMAGFSTRNSIVVQSTRDA
ncbi:MAG: hypothetical protein ABI165_10960, partial [Bryobacteraceae bacterium]